MTSVISKIKAYWLILVVVTFGCSTSPFSRTVYISPGTPVRLREDVEGVKIWVQVEGKPQPTRLTLKEGWYVVPDDE